MATTTLTRMVICAIPNDEDRDAIAKRFAGLATECKRDGKTYLSVQTRRTLPQGSSPQQPYNLVTELVFTNNEDLQYFLHEDQVHKEAVSWGKPMTTSIIGLTLDS